MGVKAQIGVAEEGTWGTYTAPTRYFELLSAELALTKETIESAAWRAGVPVVNASRRKKGATRIEGPLRMEIANKGFGLLFKHMLGTIATTTPGGGTLTRDHTATFGDLYGKGLTIQEGLDDRTATVRPFSFLGCKVTSWEISCAINEFATLTLNMVGKDVDTAQTLGTASYASGLDTFTFVEGSLTVAAGAVDIKSITLSGDNQLATDDYAFGSSQMRQPVTPARRPVTGSFDADFTSLTLFNHIAAHDEVALDLKFASAGFIEGAFKYQLEITGTVQIDADTPKASGPEEIRQPIGFTLVQPAAGGEPLTMAYQTTDTAP